MHEHKVKDFMVDVFDFPHIPYWFSLKQAAKIIKISFPKGEKIFYPPGILVFDEKYNLLGTLTLKDILKGIEPRFLKPTTTAQLPEENESVLSALWSTGESKELAEKPVSEVMVPARYFVAPEDPVTKATYLMIHHDLVLLPVLDDRKKFVGLVRLTEVFDILSNEIVKE